MKEEKAKSKKRIFYYLILAVCVLLLVAATVLTVYFVVGDGGREVLETPPVQDGPGTIAPPDSDQNVPSGGETAKEFISPLDYVRASEYGGLYRDEAADIVEMYHNAVHLYAENGANVLAMADGEVVRCDKDPDLGNIVEIEHEGGIRTFYRNLNPAETLKAGAKVKQGDVIGTVDCSYGTESKDEPHLHLEMYRNEKSIDPTSYLVAEYEEK